MMLPRCIALTTLLVLAGCGGSVVTGHTPTVPLPDPNAPKVYRTLDGKTFDTAEARSAYLHGINNAREREIFEAETFRQEQLSLSLSGVQALRRRSQLARIDRDIARAERDRRRAARDLARIARDDRRAAITSTAAARRNADIAERRARQALKAADQKLSAAKRAEKLLEREDRVARPTLRRRARPDSNAPATPVPTGSDKGSNRAEPQVE